MGFGNHSRSTRGFHHHRGGWRSYHHHGSQRFGRGICNAIWCCFCLGPILLLIGIIVIATANNNSRSEDIEEYNFAVENWIDQGYDKFAARTGEFSIRFDRGDQISLTPITDDSPLKDKGKKGDSEDILDYSGHYLLHSGKDSLRVAGLCTDRNGCDTSDRHGRFTFTAPTGESFQVPLSMFTVSTRSVEYERDCCDGCYYDSWRRECREYKILKGVSIKVSRRSDGAWVPDKSYGGIGAGDSANWGVGIYKDLRIHCRFEDCMPEYTDVPVTLRSVDDPRVRFYSIMGAGHSLDFGTSTRETVAAGIVVTVIGAIIVCGMFMMVYGIAKCTKKATVGDTYSDLQGNSSTGTAYVPPPATATLQQNQIPQPTYPQHPQPALPMQPQPGGPQYGNVPQYSTAPQYGNTHQYGNAPSYAAAPTYVAPP